MRNTILALSVGLLAGLLLTASFLRERAAEQDSQATSASSAITTVPELEQSAAEDLRLAAARALTIHVVRGGLALPGAAVSIYVSTPSSWAPVGRERSDEHGDVRFPARPGRYALRAVAPDGQATMAIETVAWSTAPVTLELAFLAGSTVKGQVVDKASRAPVPQAMVVWLPLTGELKLPPEFAIPSQADAFGRFAVQVPPRLGGSLDAHAPGYGHAQSWADDEKDTTLELTRAALVAGVVVDEEGHPVADAVVTAAPAEDVAKTTGADGRFELQVHAGGATVHALSPKGPQALARVLLEPGARRTDLRLVLTAGTALEGVVRDQAQQPLAATEVRVLAEPVDVELARVTTSATGTFTAFAIPAGRYSVAAETAQHWVGRAVGHEHPQEGPVEVTVLAGTSLEGVVKNSGGAPVANAKIELTLGPRLSTSAEAHTDEAGHFLVADLPPGEVRIHASLGSIADQERTQYLSPGETGHVEITLGMSGRVVGHVEGPGKRWNLFFLADGATTSHTEVSDDKGAFDVPLAPGSYRVFVAALHVRRHLERQIEVRPGEVTELVLPAGEEDSPEDDGGEFSEVAMRRGALGGGISFDNGPGGVLVDFLNAESRMALAGVQSGDVVVAIDGEAVRDSLDAFAKVRRPAGAQLNVTVRRGGQEQVLVVK